jgi:hypothetical protein
MITPHKLAKKDDGGSEGTHRRIYGTRTLAPARSLDRLV